ncbi:MAG: cyclic nucleotide-binding domain-containing protein [Planctomycetota bacterium]
MLETTYAPGDVIFHEGDPSRTVCLIRAGEVEVSKAMGEEAVVLGTVGEGQFVGEMGVIEQRPRGATVRAKDEVRVEMLSEAEFLARLSEDPETAMLALRRLSERLRAANDRVLEFEGAPPCAERCGEVSALEEGPEAASAALRIQPASKRVARDLDEEGVAVHPLPFHVGRPAGPGERKPPVELALAVTDSMPYRLSRLHFSILEDDGRFLVRDVSSTLGTLVNGELIGEHAARVFAPLRDGENEILAGGRDSPFAFRVVL